MCLGETLAKAELFLFFSHLVHSYRLLPELEGELPTEDYCPGFTILPKPCIQLSKTSAQVLRIDQ